MFVKNGTLVPRSVIDVGSMPRQPSATRQRHSSAVM